MLFTYQAKDPQGRTVTGSLEALDERSAVSMVRALGYFPMQLAPDRNSRSGVVPNTAPMTPQFGDQGWIEPPRPLSPGRWLVVHLIYPLWTGISLVELSMLYRQFAAMLNAGVPISRVMTSLSEQSYNPTLRKCLIKMNAVLQQGGTLSQAMGYFPWIFLDFHRALIVAGEANGDLATMFLRLSATLDQEAALRGSIKKEMFFPWLTLGANFLLPPLVDVVVYQNVRLYVEEAVLPMVSLLGIVAVIYVVTRLGSQFRLLYDTITANLIGVGGTVRMISLARFARTLASLYAAGVSVPNSVRYAAAACGNAYLGKHLAQSASRMEAGGGILESLGATRMLPPMVMSMLATGEETGSLDSMMNKVGQYYEDEADARLSRLSKSLGVLVTIGIGVRILFVLIRFYGGMANGLLKMADP